MSSLHPGLLLIFTALLLSLVNKTVRLILLLSLPIICLIVLWSLPEGNLISLSYLGYTLEPLYIDKLSRLFSTVFLLMLFFGVVYCYKQAKPSELIFAFVYSGSAISVVLAKDLISLFVFWELMAISSTMIIWSANNHSSKTAGLRYALIHFLGGVLLMTGIILHIQNTGHLSYQLLTLDKHSDYFILAGFLINAAAPPFSAWLADAYPESSFSGMVFLSAFTTKTAIFVLLRGFPGNEILVFIGLYMIFYGIIYALLENDMRRILAYSIVNQVGFMVCGIGIGTEMALNGASAHAFTHIIYKALLLMSAGAVLYQTGRRKCTDLGGLVQSMPVTAVCGIIGALSISSFPLTSGFISKSMITQSSVDEQLFTVWILLQAASAGVFLHAGIKFPWFVFFQKDSGLRPTDPPVNMQLAMVALSAICILLGVFPGVLYSILPYTVEYIPYTADHVLAQLQLLLFSGLAFFVMLSWMKRTLTISLDTDWIYRIGTKKLLHVFEITCLWSHLFVKNTLSIACFVVNTAKKQSIFSVFEDEIGHSLLRILLILSVCLTSAFFMI